MLTIKKNGNYEIAGEPELLNKSVIKSYLLRLKFESVDGKFIYRNEIPQDRISKIIAFLERFAKVEPDENIVQLKQQYQQQIQFSKQLFARAKEIKKQKEITDLTIDEMDPQKQLMPYQTVPVMHAVELGNSANFSVPGSGKTWMAYATYFLLRKKKQVDKLLVLSPLSAFKPWEEEYEQFTGTTHNLKRIVGSPDDRRLIYENPLENEMFLISYGTANNDVESIDDKPTLIDFLKKGKFMVVLDESHHIKNPEGVTASTALRIAPSAKKRMILTGTMMPNRIDDIWTQFTFLYPDMSILGTFSNFSFQNERRNAEGLTQEVYHLFTRVGQGTLNLPRADIDTVPLDMSETQKRIYAAMRAHVIDNTRMSFADLMATSRWRRNCICWLIEAATDPSLLPHRSGGEIEITALSPDTPNLEGTPLDEAIREYANPNSGDYEIPAKIDKAIELAKESIRKGEKILLWCTFINSLHRLKQELDGFLTSNGNAPAIEIWGKVPRDSEVNDQWNREDEIEKFKSSSEHNVLIANPASLAESVSLHKTCHHAVYVDRTYNCGNFVQSMQRIHRIGLPPNHKDGDTRYTILQSNGTIDFDINRILDLKLKRMRKFLNEDELGVLELDLHYGMLSDNSAEENNAFRSVLGF